MSDLELAAVLEPLVRGVAGVSTVYSSLPLLAQSAQQITRGADAAPLIAIDRSSTAVTVTVNVGVSGSAQAPATAAAVAAAVRAAVGADAEVIVRVSRVLDS